MSSSVNDPPRHLSASVNQCRFHVEAAGTGAPLVFLHGETHSTILFERQIPHFAGRYRCLAYDRRGHARSEVPLYGYSLWNQTQDLAALLDHFECGEAIIVAVAMSTAIGANFALTYPERVRALVLCSWYELDGYPALEQRRQEHRMSFADLHLMMREVLLRDGRDGLETYLEEHSAALLPIFPPDKPEIRRKLVAMFACHHPDHYVQSAEYYTSIPNLRTAMHAVRCPLLGVCGSDDPSPDRPELMHGVANFRQVWIKGARRFTMMEEPGAFNSVLDGFLAEIG